MGPMDITLTSFGQTDVGLKRPKNEDSFLVDDSIGLFIVADGMGGHKGGDLASSMAVEILRAVVSHSIKRNTGFFSPRDILIDGYIQASQQIYHKSHIEQPELQGMGTTLVSALIHKGILYFGNVGDSRAYMIREGKMWQMTEDHSLLNEHIRAGFLKDTEIAKFQAKNVITRSVGFEREALCDVVERKVESGDRYLMCSDGLSGLVRPERILELCQNPDIKAAVSSLIEEAKANGGDDNITVIIIDASRR
ncbi:MAG: Stp1/IreP family PP2C-type Ser/Thr phosphatase [Bdellovibrionales bacterium]|nr:Stp1/IreP family PP2C-type Ser/Thr phosphatase [Bdellovibrionales bacterium]